MKRWIVIMLGGMLLCPAGAALGAAPSTPREETAAAAEALPAGEAEMGYFRLRRTFKEAEEARRQGRFPEARELYRRVLAATEGGEKRRLQALYGLALTDLRLSPQAFLDETRAALDELRSHPGSPHRQEAETLLALTDQVARIQDAAGEAEWQLWELESECAATRAELERELAAAARQADEQAFESWELRDRLAAAQEEIARLEDEVARQRRALERLKKALLDSVPRR